MRAKIAAEPHSVSSCKSVSSLLWFSGSCNGTTIVREQLLRAQKEDSLEEQQSHDWK